MNTPSEFKIEIQFEEKRLQKKDSQPQDSLVNTQLALKPLARLHTAREPTMQRLLGQLNKTVHTHWFDK